MWWACALALTAILPGQAWQRTPPRRSSPRMRTGSRPSTTSARWPAWPRWCEDATPVDGAYKHSCYMLQNDIAHDEIPGRPGYTPEGDAAGNNGNVAVSSVAGTSARSHIELWMTGPFHAIGVLRPNLQRVGFGKCDNASGPEVALGCHPRRAPRPRPLRRRAPSRCCSPATAPPPASTSSSSRRPIPAPTAGGARASRPACR